MHGWLRDRRARKKGFLTSDERRAGLERREAERVYEVADRPVALVGGELVVYDGERDERDARVERLSAVERGQRPARGHGEPPEEDGVGERDAPRGERAVRLVLRVLVRVHRLVRDVELEQMQP